jgi:hypothetical protein
MQIFDKSCLELMSNLLKEEINQTNRYKNLNNKLNSEFKNIIK